MMTRWWAIVGVILFAGPSALAQEPASLEPGLIAEYRSEVDASARPVRIDAKPAFWLGTSSPHPRLPAGPFAVDWNGVLVLNEPGPIRFSAAVCGEVSIALDTETVFSARGDRESYESAPGPEIRKPPGVYRIAIHFQSARDRPARLQVLWQGTGFAKEPLPAWSLKHSRPDAPAALETERLAEAGRRAVGAYGCARCHAAAFPAVADAPPGPSLADAPRRLSRDWLVRWLANPSKEHPDAHMPALFADDRTGFVERWLIARQLAQSTAKDTIDSLGDHRRGRVQYISVGCIACHRMPDQTDDQRPAMDRTRLVGLADRYSEADVTAFLCNPTARYPDARMPHIPLTPTVARDIAAFLLLWSKPDGGKSPETPPSAAEIQVVTSRLKSADPAAALIREKRCAECHPGLGKSTPSNLPIANLDARRGCLSDRSRPHFGFDEHTRAAIAAYTAVAKTEIHLSPYAARQWQLERAGCVRCHQRDSDRPSPLEMAAATLGGSGLETVPFQRAPRLTAPNWKFTGQHLLDAVRDGVSGLRAPRYTYLMPAYGAKALELVQALAEADGDRIGGPEMPPTSAADATTGSLHGPTLVSSGGYACVSCHVWNGRMLADQDPGATGPDLLRVPGRIRRDWFDRYLEAPTRAHPGTPMPAIFPKDQPATLRSVLDGDAARQKDALWSYFSLGKQAPSPLPAPALAIAAPAGAPLIAQIPIRLPAKTVVEGIVYLTAESDLLLYDLGAGALHSAYVGANILRSVQGRLRTNTVSGTPAGHFAADPPWQLVVEGRPSRPVQSQFLGYDRTSDGCRIRRRIEFDRGALDVVESLGIGLPKQERLVVHGLQIRGIPEKAVVQFACRDPSAEVLAVVGKATSRTVDGVFQADIEPNDRGAAHVHVTHPLPAARRLQSTADAIKPLEEPLGGSLARPGYRAIAYPRPKTTQGDDLVMPGALAINPRDGRVFVASLKSGAIHVLRDPTDDGRQARFDDYACGMFQDCLAMRGEADGLYVLHRRGFTKIHDDDERGRARSFDRLATLNQGITDNYDYAYGLVRDRSGAFVYTYAPYADTSQSGAGSALRWTPGQTPREIGYGFRNPLGWCTDAGGEVFFTDNQGEWVATNKLCHLVEGRFYGFPNPRQPEHHKKPGGKAAVWIPYSWAHSINGVTCDTTGGKFGPFAGQFFLAELVFGGAIIRADLERVNGEYQGACFPFWGRGLLGPLTLAFDPRGRLFVGSLTEPGWMAQPDRGALFRIDYTGAVPFEIKTIRIRPQGFRIEFTRPVDAATARDPAAYRIESWRYEYTGAYGSPEFDRALSPIERVEQSDDGLTANLIIKPPLKGRVYLIHANGVRSRQGEALLHPAGAYTVNEVPSH